MTGSGDRNPPFDLAAYARVKANWDAVAKPLDGMGCFEEILCRIGALHGTDEIDIRRRAVIVMCADNGIVAEGVSQSGSEVTRTVAEWLGRGESSVCRLAAGNGTDVLPVDIGIASEDTPEGVLPRKIAQGTKDFLLGPAMTEEECAAAIRTGRELVRDCKTQGYRILATGEMGIGNTTTSAAVAAALLQLTPDEVTGAGAGLPPEGIERKKQVIREGLARYAERLDSPLEVLRCLGGLDLAGLTGIFLGGAQEGIPIVIDGLISAAAALLAERIAPGTRRCMIASHLGKEPALRKLMASLGLAPIIHAELALGEGTGAVMLLSLLDLACLLYREGTRFKGSPVQAYQRFSRA